jgi:hypothetical protein
MLRARRLVLLLLLASLAAGCSSTSNGVATIEARGAVALYGASEITGASRGYGHYEASSAGGGFGIAGNLSSALRSYGLRASINMTGVDVIGGTDEHRIEGQDVTEANVGLRKRFGESGVGTFYVDMEWRHGFGLETSSGRRDYDGMELGAGVILQLSKRWFLDFGLGWERTFGQLELDSGREHLSEALVTLGFGFSL